MKILVLALFALSAFSQEAPPVKINTPPRFVTRVMEFVADDGEKMRKIAELFSHRLNRIHVEPSVGLMVMTGTEADVNEVEAAIKRHYKPKPLEAGISGPPNRNIELVLHVLHAKSEGGENSVPPGLQPVVQQLKQVSNLTSFRTIDSQIVRVRGWETVQTLGVLQWPEAPEKAAQTYEFRAKVSVKGVVIQCDNLLYIARIPYATAPDQIQYREIKISTAVDLKPGQATVIGKTNASAKDGSIVLVLTARFVD